MFLRLMYRPRDGTEWSKAEREGEINLSLYVESKKKSDEWTYLQNRNRLTGLEKELTVAEGKNGGRDDWKFKINMCTLLYLKQNAFHETIIKAMQVGQIKRWCLFCLRYPVWCHLLHEDACVCANADSHVQLFVAPWMLCSSLGPSVHGIVQVRILKWVSFPF